MVDALTRLDQTDALVEQTLGDRAKMEHNVKRGHAQSSHYMQRQASESEVTARTELNHYPDRGTEWEFESDQLDWDPERVDDDGASTLVLGPRDGPLDQADASSLSAWAQG